MDLRRIMTLSMNQMRKPSMIAHLGLWKMTENQTQMQFRSVTHVLNTVRLLAEIKVCFSNLNFINFGTKLCWIWYERKQIKKKIKSPISD